MGVELRIWERSYPTHSCVKEKPEQPKTYPPHFSVNCFPHGGLSKAVLSGPDGLSVCRAHVLLDKRPIANYQFTSEASYDAEYLWRPAHPSATPVHLRPRSAFAGEVGWHTFVCQDPEPTSTGHQILTSEFWRQCNDRASHRYQDVWYPGPGESGTPEQTYYFSRFPSTGLGPRRAQTSYGDSRPTSMVGSSGTPNKPVAPRAHRSRVPLATKTTNFDDVNNISVEQSEEGSSKPTANQPGGSSTQSTNPRLLKSRHNSPGNSRKTRATDSSNNSSSYTTYMHLPLSAQA